MLPLVVLLNAVCTHCQHSCISTIGGGWAWAVRLQSQSLLEISPIELHGTDLLVDMQRSEWSDYFLRSYVAFEDSTLHIIIVSCLEAI